MESIAFNGVAVKPPKDWEGIQHPIALQLTWYKKRMVLRNYLDVGFRTLIAVNRRNVCTDGMEYFYFF